MYEDVTTDSIVHEAKSHIAQMLREQDVEDIMLQAHLDLIGFMIEELARRITVQRERLVQARKAGHQV